LNLQSKKVKEEFLEEVINHIITLELAVTRYEVDRLLELEQKASTGSEILFHGVSDDLIASDSQIDLELSAMLEEEKQASKENYHNLTEIEGQILHELIKGVRDAPNLTIEEAIQYAKEKQAELSELKNNEIEFISHNWEENISQARSFAEEKLKSSDQPKLGKEDIAIIHSYTQQSPLFKILNERLRSPKREDVKPFLPLLKLIGGSS